MLVVWKQEVLNVCVGDGSYRHTSAELQLSNVALAECVLEMLEEAAFKVHTCVCRLAGCKYTSPEGSGWQAWSSQARPGRAVRRHRLQVIH